MKWNRKRPTRKQILKPDSDEDELIVEDSPTSDEEDQRNSPGETVSDTPSSEESEKLARKIISHYKSGIMFSELAVKYSKDKFYAKKGGDIGWVKKGDMMKEIDEAIFSHKKGDIFAVNVAKWGWTIILINESPIVKEFAEILIVKK